MGKDTHSSYSRAGTARRSGRGLSMDIAGARYYITPQDISSLMVDRAVEVVDESGENEGTAWLSPFRQPKKQDLTALIRRRIYVVTCRDMHRVIQGRCSTAPVREYHPLLRKEIP